MSWVCSDPSTIRNGRVYACSDAYSIVDTGMGLCYMCVSHMAGAKPGDTVTIAFGNDGKYCHWQVTSVAKGVDNA